jgi:hypothetical protein
MLHCLTSPLCGQNIPFAYKLADFHKIRKKAYKKERNQQGLQRKFPFSPWLVALFSAIR